jgi:hypothetical protein
VQAHRCVLVFAFLSCFASACGAILGDFEVPSRMADAGDGANGGAADAVSERESDAQRDAASVGDGGRVDAGGSDARGTEGGSGEGGRGDAGGADGGGGAGDSGEAGAPLPAIDVLDFALGSQHSCAVVRYTPSDDASAARTVTYCWGANDRGQLGGGTVVPLPDGGIDAGAPTFVVAQVASPIAHISASPTSNHTCAYDTGGQVWCWGANDLGQVNGTAANPMAAIATPVRLANANTGGALTASLLAVGANHACAADTRTSSSAPIFCWGSNDHCQDGYVTGGMCPPVSGVVPSAALSTATPVFALALGGNATLVEDQRVSGTHAAVDFIGDSANGQCYGQAIGDISSPIECANAGEIYPVDLSMGSGHGCEIGSLDGGANQVYCWGDNSTLQVDPSFTGGGHLGAGPVFTAYTDAPKAVGAGNGVSCTVFMAPSGNYLACQGANSHYQLAQDTNLQPAGPVIVKDAQGRPIDVISVHLGSAHVCALTRGARHTLLCWGDNSVGEVGTPVSRNAKGTLDVLSPTQVAFPPQAP